MIKGMIFDLDGTTLNTLGDLHESFNKALKEYGLPLKTIDEIRMGVGSGMKVLVERCTPEDLSEETKTELGKRYWQIYSENYANTTAPYEGMKELMNELQNRGIALAVNSNKGDDIVKQLMMKCYPEISFVEVLGERAGVARKPDPQGPELIIEKMGLTKEEVVYVGDSDVDIKTAKNTGVRSIGCLWGFRDEKVLREAGADVLVSKPSEILEYIKGEEQ